ncbi:hypothetical protein BaRGS_00006700 [Batillaria attramentaria]|uniref:Uncharacterized protein n=1 Tax=Batillaria attramentaria TaxID=370345 RepID=A0ABD0LSA0_9CAEN
MVDGDATERVYRCLRFWKSELTFGIADFHVYVLFLQNSSKLYKLLAAQSFVLFISRSCFPCWCPSRTLVSRCSPPFVLFTQRMITNLSASAEDDLRHEAAPALCPVINLSRTIDPDMHGDVVITDSTVSMTTRL